MELAREPVALDLGSAQLDRVARGVELRELGLRPGGRRQPAADHAPEAPDGQEHHHERDVGLDAPADPLERHRELRRQRRDRGRRRGPRAAQRGRTHEVGGGERGDPALGGVAAERAELAAGDQDRLEAQQREQRPPAQRQQRQREHDGERELGERFDGRVLEHDVDEPEPDQQRDRLAGEPAEPRAVVVLAELGRRVEPGGARVAQAVDEAAQFRDRLAGAVAGPRQQRLRACRVAPHRRPRLPEQELHALGEHRHEPAHLGGDAPVLRRRRRDRVCGEPPLQLADLPAERDDLAVAVAHLPRDEHAAAAERGRVDPDAQVGGAQQRRLVDLEHEHGAAGRDQHREQRDPAPGAGPAVGDGAEEAAEHDPLRHVGVDGREIEPQPRHVEAVRDGGHQHGQAVLGEEHPADGEREQPPRAAGLRRPRSAARPPRTARTR